MGSTHRAPDLLTGPSPQAGAWIQRPTPRPQAPLQLVCFHHAGGGASSFRAWPALMTDVEVLVVQLPGREGRFTETPASEPAAVVEPLVTELRGALRQPYVLFGHSLGARLALEVAARLEAVPGLEPCLTIVSAAPPPAAPAPDEEPALPLSDDALLAMLRRLGGTPPALLAQPAFMRPFLRVMRADVDLARAFSRHAAPVLAGPLFALAGEADPGARPHLMAGWSAFTRGTFAAGAVLDGGHFYHQDRPAQSVEMVRAAMASTAALNPRYGPAPTLTDARLRQNARDDI
jgi:surfactin synthase thioesterase subunit